MDTLRAKDKPWRSEGKRNGTITLLKLIFTGVIIFMHYSIPCETGGNEFLFGGGYIYVDFFFILQGFYLIKNADYKVEIDAFEYFKKRIKRFFPCVLVAGFVMLIFSILEMGGGLVNICECLLQYVVQLSFLSQMMPFSYLGMGGILWFLSASIFAGTLAIVIISVTRAKTPIVTLFLGASLYNMIISNNGNTDLWHGTILGGASIGGIPRALAGIMIGISVRYLSDKINHLILRRWVVTAARFVGLILVVLTILLVVYNPHTLYDAFQISIFSILLLMGNYPANIIKCKGL